MCCENALAPWFVEPISITVTAAIAHFASLAIVGSIATLGASLAVLRPAAGRAVLRTEFVVYTAMEIGRAMKPLRAKRGRKVQSY